MPRLWDAVGGVTLVVFALSVYQLSERRAAVPTETADLSATPEADTLDEGREWLGLYFNDQKLGFSRIERTRRPEGGLRFAHETRLKLDALGVSQRMDLDLTADLSPTLALERFDFALTAGDQSFSGSGRVVGLEVQVELRTGGETVSRRVTLTGPPVLREALGPLFAQRAPTPGSRFVVESFDPWSTGLVPIEIEVVGPDTVMALEQVVAVTHVRQKVQGMVLDAWISPRGEVLKQTLPLGLTARRESEEEARWGLAAERGAQAALLDALEVPVRGLPDRLDALDTLRLRVRGPDAARNGLSRPPRQRLESPDLLVVSRVALPPGLPRPLPSARLHSDPEVREALRPEALVQSTHPRIRQLAAEIVGDAPDTVEATRRVVAWMRRELVSERATGAPSALEMLERRRGDCNDWAVLFAALARASGVPARLAFGLLWETPRFRYHAWNEVLTTEGWVPVDALWAQFPVELGHLALAVGDVGRQIDLLNSMGRLSFDWAP
ncbi:MAG: transglutaminase domain-containing protein [Bradymonadia bacterium]